MTSQKNFQNLRQFLTAGLLILTVLVLAWKGILPGWKDKPSDFNNYYVAAKLVTDGESIHQFYDNDWFNVKARQIGIKDGAKFSPFPPITAFVMLPLSPFKPINAKRIWLVFNVFLLAILPFRIKKITSWSLLNSALFLSVFTIPIASNLNAGQLYLAIGFLLIEILGQAYFKYKSRLIGSLIALVTLLKYIPALFLAYTFNFNKRTTIWLWFTLVVAVSILGLYQLKNEPYSAFFDAFTSHIQGDLPGQGKYAHGFQSIDALLNNLFVPHPIDNPNPIFNLPILKPIMKFSFLLGVLGLLFLMLKKGNYRLSNELISIALIGAFLVVPASASYHFLLLIWPLLCLYIWLAGSNDFKKRIALTAIVIISFTVQVYHIPNLPQLPLMNLLLHYPRFWSLLCLFLLSSYFYFNQADENYG